MTYEVSLCTVVRSNGLYKLVEHLCILGKWRIPEVVGVLFVKSAQVVIAFASLKYYFATLLLDDFLGLFLAQANRELFSFSQRVGIVCFRG